MKEIELTEQDIVFLAELRVADPCDSFDADTEAAINDHIIRCQADTLKDASRKIVDMDETLATLSGDRMITRKALNAARATIKLLVAALVAVGIINGVVMASIIWGR